MYQLHWRAALVLGGALTLGGCGTYVPNLQEFPASSADGQLLARAIAAKVQCEIQSAVAYVVDQDKQLASVNQGVRNAEWFDDWGVQYLLTLKIEESSTANPNILWSPPSPSNSIFMLGAGLNLSATATRDRTMSFFYTVRQLTNMKACERGVEPQYRAQSLLAQDDLKLTQALVDYILMIGTGAGTAPTNTKTPIQKKALSDVVRFRVVTGAGITPSWQLARLNVNRSGTLLNATRDRIHELSITYGPADPDTGNLVGSAATQFLASQIAAAIDRDE